MPHIVSSSFGEAGSKHILIKVNLCPSAFPDVIEVLVLPPTHTLPSAAPSILLAPLCLVFHGVYGVYDSQRIEKCNVHISDVIDRVETQEAPVAKMQ